MNVMIIDDSSTVRKFLTQALEETGAAIQEAENGQDAIDKLRDADNVDLFLVDWNMPVMNGLEFVQAVRKDDRYKNIPLVMVTTEDEMESVVAAIEAGANEYLMKPFTPEGLMEKLRIVGVVE